MAPPELRTTALTTPSFTTSLLHSTGLARQRLAVKTLALANDGPSLTTRATSVAPLDLSPAATPDARKPWGAVTLMAPSPVGAGCDLVASSLPLGGGTVGVPPAGTRIQSVSKVERVKTLIEASASGTSSSARTPVSEKSSGPCTSNAVNGIWWVTSAGTAAAAHTTDVSAAVAVTEKTEEDSAQGGTSAPGPSRTTARASGCLCSE